MPADESLGAYQFGRYMVTKEFTEASERTDDRVATKPYTRYVMTRQPSEVEREGLGDRNAPAFEASTMDITHHPAIEPLPPRDPAKVPRASWLGVAGGGATYSEGYKAKRLPTDEVDYLTVEKASRVMVPTMLGLGQRQAKANTGKDLRASPSLSEHSQRLVDKLKASGMVPEDHFSIPNEMNFLPAWPVNTPGGLEGHLSTLLSRIKRDDAQEFPIPATEVAAAKQEGRNMVRRTRPKRGT
jgi:hypothetical protein